MNVKVKLFASLRKFGPDVQMIDLPDATTIDAVERSLNLPPTIRLLRVVNGEHRAAGHILQEGDELALFPPIAGG